MPVSINGNLGITFPDGSLQTAAASPFGLKNRIINGDMVIDQRNNGASVTATTSAPYTLDRWTAYSSTTGKFTVQQNAGSVTPPAGFTNYLGVTSTSAYTVTSTDIMNIVQYIEGYNVADLDFGKSTAKTITISFWVRSSLTGTFGGSILNSAQNRSYPFSYTISAANTWEQKSITIAGDTTGTWLTTNGIGIMVQFALGVGSTYSGTAGAWTSTSFISSVTGATSVVGTNGATFYITGVQLERNTTATPFEWIPYGQELMLCQRYYYKISGAATDRIAIGHNSTTTNGIGTSQFPVTLRTAPTALEQSGTATHYEVQHGNIATTCSAVPTFATASTNMATSTFIVASGLTAGQGSNIRLANASGYIAWSAEL